MGELIEDASIELGHVDRQRARCDAGSGKRRAH